VTRTLLGVFGFLSLHGTAAAQAVGTRERQPADTQHIVFVCEHGSVKSMIAASLFNRMAADRGLAARAASRGTVPDSAVPELVRRGLRNEGVDIGDLVPIGLSSASTRGADLFVVFDVSVPAAVAKPVEMRRWDGTPSVMSNYSKGSAAIANRVRDLVDELSRSSHAKRSTGGGRGSPPPRD
jgi:arsenate reductase (thioredoxin)